MSWIAVALLLMPRAEVEVLSTVAPLGRLLPDLSQRAGIKLLASASVQGDVVAISSPKRPIRELMDGIARAANATWEERKEGWVLIRTKAQEDQDEAKELIIRAAWIKKAIEQTNTDEPFDATRAAALADYRYEFKSKKEHTPGDYAQLPVMNARSPLGRLSRRVVEAIGVETFARLPQGKRTVLSNRPTKMQRPLVVKDLKGLIEQFRTEQNAYASAAKAKGQPQGGENTTFVSGFDYVQEIPEEWDRVLVIVETFNVFQTFVHVKLADRQGNHLASVRCYMNRENFGSQPQAEPNTPTIEFSSETIEILRARSAGGELTDTQRMPFRDPATRDPLDFVHREALQTWSTFNNKPVIALLADNQTLGFGIRQPYVLGSYKLQVKYGSEVVENDSMIVITPKEPASARRSRANRAVLSAYISSYRQKGYATLDSQMKLSTASESMTASSVDSALRLALPGRQPAFSSLALLRLLVLAHPSMREGLLAGGTVTLAEMNPAQRAWATDLLFNADHLGNTMRVNSRSPNANNVAGEITEAYPNGLPGTASIRTNASEVDAVRFKQQGQFVLDGEETLASYLFQPEAEQPKEFQYGRLRSFEVHLDLNPESGTYGTYREEMVDPNSPWKAYQQLPQAFRDKVDARLKALRDRYKPPPAR